MQGQAQKEKMHSVRRERCPAIRGVQAVGLGPRRPCDTRRQGSNPRDRSGRFGGFACSPAGTGNSIRVCLYERWGTVRADRLSRPTIWFRVGIETRREHQRRRRSVAHRLLVLAVTPAACWRALNVTRNGSNVRAHTLGCNECSIPCEPNWTRPAAQNSAH